MDVKRRKVDGDVSPEVVAEIVATITEPEKMLGPDVSCLLISCLEFDEVMVFNCIFDICSLQSINYRI